MPLAKNWRSQCASIGVSSSVVHSRVSLLTASRDRGGLVSLALSLQSKQLVLSCFRDSCTGLRRQQNFAHLSVKATFAILSSLVLLESVGSRFEGWPVRAARVCCNLGRREVAAGVMIRRSVALLSGIVVHGCLLEAPPTPLTKREWRCVRFRCVSMCCVSRDGFWAIWW